MRELEAIFKYVNAVISLIDEGRDPDIPSPCKSTPAMFDPVQVTPVKLHLFPTSAQVHSDRMEVTSVA